eukprot:1668398-Rhodomonas_salina.3
MTRIPCKRGDLKAWQQGSYSLEAGLAQIAHLGFALPMTSVCTVSTSPRPTCKEHRVHPTSTWGSRRHHGRIVARSTRGLAA